MRLTLQIFGTVFLSSLLLGGLLVMGIDFKRMHDIVELSSALPASMKSLLSSSDADAWRTAALFWLVVALGSVVGIVATWLRKRILGLVVGSALALLTVLAAILQPHLESVDDSFMQSIGTNVAVFGGAGVVILLVLHTVVRE